MEKKSSKFVQPSGNKATATADAKKSQETNNANKPFPKAPRKREPANVNGNAFKSNSGQKSRNFDKRPKPKGQYYGCPKEDTKVATSPTAELGSVMAPGSKKQNLNHLLNFHYAPRDVEGSSSSSWSHGRPGFNNNNNRNKNRWLPPVQRHRYDKNQFLLASCQFVVANGGDYSSYLKNPNILVEWTAIEQIRLHSQEKLSCPICLYPPVAGKMTRCGHVYCWPCILHYLSLSDKSWRNCPICDESVNRADLKSVAEVTQSAFNVGDTVNLRLMRKERDSLLAVPVENPLTPKSFVSLTDNLDNEIYSKLLIAKPADVIDIIECERAQLNLELVEDPHSPENCFIEQALMELSKRESLIMEAKKSLRENSKETIAMTNNDTANPPEFCYFYQAVDGQNIYLNAINVKMLEMQYNSLESCPSVISGKLLDKEIGCFTEDLKRRCHFLNHLPLTSQIELAEIEILPPLVSPEVYDSFKDKLLDRQRKRQRKERDERKRERKIEQDECRRSGKFPATKVHIESSKHFPQWLPEQSSSGINIPSPTESTTSSVASSPSSSTFEELSRPVTPPASLSSSHDGVGPSFAQMLRNKTCGGAIAGGGGWPSVARAQQAQEEAEDYQSPIHGETLADVFARANIDSGARRNNVGRKKKKKNNKPSLNFEM